MKKPYLIVTNLLSAFIQTIIQYRGTEIIID